MRLHLVTVEDPITLQTRAREWIRFPQLTMPLLAALTPEPWVVTHTDEITHAVDTTQSYELVGLTAATPGAPHAYALAQAFRARGSTVAMGGPHATLLPQEVARHVDVVVVGEAETIWPRVLHDLEREVVYAPGHHALEPVTGPSVEVRSNRGRIYRCEVGQSERVAARQARLDSQWTLEQMVGDTGRDHRHTWVPAPV